MAKVEVSGFPHRDELHNILFHLQRLLSKDNIKKFWIRELSDIRGMETRMAVIEFESSQDAMKAYRRLDGFLYISREGEKFPLTAQMEDKRKRKSQSPRRAAPKLGHIPGAWNDRRHSRSRSPVQKRHHYHSETSKLDVRFGCAPTERKVTMEIELLRKQRLVIEEERRLLMERKKLELIKDLSRNDMAELDRSDERERRGTDERHTKEKDSHGHSLHTENPQLANKSPPQKLPSHVLPCKKILLEMEDLITSASSYENVSRWSVRKKTRMAVRKRLKEVLQNKEYMPTDEIFALYRSLYPMTSDEELVKKLAKESNLTKKHQVKDHRKLGHTNQMSDVNLPEASIAEKNDKNEINEMNYDNVSLDGAMSLTYDGDSNSDWIDSDPEL